jgi:hypothetical protein
MEAQCPHRCENFGGSPLCVLPCRSFDNREQFPLQRAVIVFRPLAQPFHNIVRGVFDRKINGHGSTLAPEWIFYTTPNRFNATINLPQRRPNRR